MKPDEILTWCLENLDDSVFVKSWGEKGVFYNPGRQLKRGIYVLTIKEKDGKNDKGSNLDREGVFRVNFGLKKSTFQRLFGPLPARPPAGGVVEMPYDFSAADHLLPHPVYGWMGWVCILNPSEAFFPELKPLILESYSLAVEKFKRR